MTIGKLTITTPNGSEMEIGLTEEQLKEALKLFLKVALENAVRSPEAE